LDKPCGRLKSGAKVIHSDETSKFLPHFFV